ncbi:hypothetical protein [Nostoc sp.]|uniref:hypothetical protein n=1 Tax=Nostoc sp. TaxID=1180 RepID=UPI002FFA49D7
MKAELATACAKYPNVKAELATAKAEVATACAKHPNVKAEIATAKAEIATACAKHSNVKAEVGTAKADWKWLATMLVSQLEDGIKGQALALQLQPDLISNPRA